MKKIEICFSPLKIRSKILFFLSLVIIINIPCFSQTRCNSWLYISGERSGVDIGSIGVTGQKITVECLFNRTTPYDPISNGGELISNHCSPENVNYLLRPNSASITTTNGFFQVITSQEISLNVTYHTAMVYDGSWLKLYRNGILVAQTAASGNLLGNLFTTKIGRTACVQSVWPTDFVGYMNEVRVWNVDRSQIQIQSNMSGILANPSAQVGLLSYYTFTSLYDKVSYGTTYNLGSFFGRFSTPPVAVSINQNNTNQNFSVCDIDRTGPPPPPITTPISTNTNLKVSAVKSGVNIGNLNMTGNQLTIEAVFARTGAYDPVYSGGEIVSKHCTPQDANYLLRPNEAGIRTSNGYFSVKSNCIYEVTLFPIVSNSLYHIAMVYNGIRLKLYRNGTLVGDVPATGNLSINNYSTKIGNIACTANAYPSDFLGYIDDVRFWNTARSEADIRTYKFKRINTPQTQPNLVAYYIFSSLQNQVNPLLYNGSIFGTAAINQTNPFSYGGAPNTCAVARVSVQTSNENVSIRPNPSIDNIKFTSSCTNCQSVILDNTGKIIKSFKAVKGINNIYIGDLSKGLYFLKQINNIMTITKKFVKL
jgi:hypothetical protein